MELSLFFYVMGIASLLLIPVLIYSGIDYIGPVTWLLIVSVYIFVRRNIADRHLSKAPSRKVGNTTLLWFILFLVLCETSYYWQHPVNLHKAFDDFRNFQPPQ